EPNPVLASGFSPLLVAHYRAQAALIELLQSHGARASSVSGRDAPGWGAEGECFRDRLRARGELDVASRGDRIPTGIRAVDGLAPIETGMLVAVRGGAETGLTVLCAEVALRLQALGLPVTWWSTAPQPWFRAELETIAAGAGLAAEVAVAPRSRSCALRDRRSSCLPRKGDGPRWKLSCIGSRRRRRW
ncbi:MAG: hypothetical protein AAFU79_37610, partial [Myxococcota bacterium]